MEDQSILEPLKAYQNTLKNKFSEKAKEYLAELTKQSGVNVEENKKTVAAYRTAKEKSEKAQRKLNSITAIKVLLIVLAVASLIGIAVCIYYAATREEKTLPVLLAVAFLVVGIVCIVLVCTVVKKVIKERQVALKKLLDRVQALLSEAQAQMAPLNALFDWNIPNKIINRTTSLIEMDDCFNVEKYEYLSRSFGLSDQIGENASTCYVLSGSIVGNPFLVRRDFKCRMLPKVYEGSLTIHWTDHGVDSKGRPTTIHRSETLHASVTKPAPDYLYETKLIFGSEVAPDLTFDRTPSGTKGMTEREIEKKIQRDDKKMNHMEREAVESGSMTSFTKIDNFEFESLFGAWNRNNEVQFRLLFTPLAQTNMEALIRNQEPYGDDFCFTKEKKLNYVSSDHGNAQDLSADPRNYMSYDYEEITKKFLSYNETYFASLYFDLAPILSIPLYQQHKPKEYLYGETLSRNYTNFEAECMANSFEEKAFRPDHAETPSILKSTFLQKDGKFDHVSVQANAYRTERHTEYVSVFGGDMRSHSVPVDWDEYIPVSKNTTMAFRSLPVSRREYTNSVSRSEELTSIRKKATNTVFRRGFLAFCVDEMLTKTDDARLDNLLKHKEN
ncbi:MAG: hypothetical protein J6D37_04840 [Clostridia bacterium]|nr:hypothetical protein [Clostridia bacterium]